MAKELKAMSEEEQRKWARHRCAELIAENMEDESEAIKKYLPLIFMLEDNGFKKAANSLREIIADEKNHLLILQGMLLEFDGDIPVASDDVNGALRRIKDAMKEEDKQD